MIRVPANTCGSSNEEKDRFMYRPSPCVVPIHSAVKAPRMAYGEVISSPVSVYARVWGKMIWRNICHRLAPIVFITSIMSLFTELSPNRVLMVIGKNVTHTTTPILGALPKPNHSMIRGATAIVGVACDSTVMGYSRSSKGDMVCMMMASSVPKMSDRSRPMYEIDKVYHRCLAMTSL